jgi:hypothetical protein
MMAAKTIPENWISSFKFYQAAFESQITLETS